MYRAIYDHRSINGVPDPDSSEAVANSYMKQDGPKIDQVTL
jgi:hypothetical protein